MRLTFLGTGTSHGIPMIACSCPVCTSMDPKNHRTRTSAAVSDGRGTLLIDTTPELRIQAIAAGLHRVDAVLFTHAHADHIFGLDDIRRFNEIQGHDMHCYGTDETLAAIRNIFDYIFMPTQEGGGKPRVSLFPVHGRFEAAGMKITPVPIMHGELPILGYRVGRLAYLTDCSEIPEASFDLLQDLDVLVLGALRPKPHPTHFSLDQAIEAARRIAAPRTYCVHMSHHLDHEQTNRRLPAGIELACDCLKIDVRD